MLAANTRHATTWLGFKPERNLESISHEFTPQLFDCIAANGHGSHSSATILGR